MYVFQKAKENAGQRRIGNHRRPWTPATLAKSNVETKRLRMNHTNFQKQTLKALHQAKKTENGRQMEYRLALHPHDSYNPD
ncbi:hypothetical protein EVAR_33266_1 [Eumeta japonica]|uniref:Uncharacterized protein n=1 Tax=Eumeta variegata TaxID=151549 RepID=A0A4C1X2R7_EUMVA|nr:hypothetical protein EVAR_33266_1 [Eumeta japonica]